MRGCLKRLSVASDHNGFKQPQWVRKEIFLICCNFRITANYASHHCKIDICTMISAISIYWFSSTFLAVGSVVVLAAIFYKFVVTKNDLMREILGLKEA